MNSKRNAPIGWRALNSQLNTMPEADVLRMLTEERATHKRSDILQRLHQRYNALRVARERIELLREATRP